MPSKWLVFALALASACQSEGKLEPHKKPDPVPTDPTTEPTDLGPLPAVVINEVMPANASTLQVPDTTDTPDWIELENVGDVPVDLSELALRSGAGDRWTGPAGQTLDPGARVLIWADDVMTGELVTGFALDKDGDKLTLLDSNDRVVDFADLPDLGDDVAWARLPDGVGEFQATAWPTPDAENGDEASPTLNPASETVFQTYVMHQIRFTFTEQALNQINLPARPEVHVELDIDGVRYPDVGLALKGSASYQRMNGKPAFKIDFNQWVPGTKFRGLKALKLHNGVVLDPTRNRDYLSYGLAREAGLMAPRVGWAEVWCNDTYYGLYIVVEKHDDAFIEYHKPGQRDLGVVLEPNESQSGGWGWGDFGQGNVTNWDYEEGPVPPDPASIDALVTADTLIGSQPTDANVEQLWEVMDKEQFLTYLAWETVIMHTDGYRAPNNWRVFVDGVTHKIQLLPAGVEWTWDSQVTAWNFNGAAGNWCLRNDGCEREYAEHILEVADLVEQMDLATQFDDLQTWLDPYIDSDPRYQGAWDTVAGARQSTQQHLQQNPNAARQQVHQRYPEL